MINRSGRALPVKKNLSVVVAAALVTLLISGLSCMSSATYPMGSIAGAPSAAESRYQTYITPQDQSVQETLRDILGAPPYDLCQAGFDDIRDWVACNVNYKSDEREDYWQSSEETLNLHIGDCEDFSILLCSLLRAYGIDPAQVFVALGDDGQGEGHAFIIEDWNQDGDWQRIEPQASSHSSSGWLGSFEADLDAELGKYDITLAFNDLYYCDNSDSFSWSEGQANAWGFSDLTGVVRSIANGLTRGVQYLLRLLLG
jgi:predicted transglutaminase-like cysteine proteinase